MSFKQIFIHSWLKYVLSFVYGILVLVIFNSLRSWTILQNYIDGLFIAGFTLVCFGLLSVISYFGGNDIFSYMFARRNERGVKPSYYEYTINKREKRKSKGFSFVPYFVIGAFFILISTFILIFS